MSNSDRTQFIFGVLIIMPMFLLLAYGMFTTSTEEKTTKFEVVDQYESCKVIRYTDTTQRWHYFLQCP